MLRSLLLTLLLVLSISYFSAFRVPPRKLVTIRCSPLSVVQQQPAEKEKENVFQELLRAFLESLPWTLTGDKEIDPEKVINDPPKYTTPGTSDVMRKRKKKTDATWLTKEEATERFVHKYLPFRQMKKSEEKKSSSMILRTPHEASTAVDENKKK